MKVGLLECDHVSERYRAHTPDYAELFAALLPHAELVPYDVVKGVVPDDPSACDGWLATGSRHSVYDDLAWIADTEAFVREVAEAGVPFVGVCFGHQLLAHALGGTVEKASSGWGAGIRRIDIVRAEPWMDPPQEQVHLHFMHQDQVTKPPPDSVVLASTDHCEVAMFRRDTMLGMQAHPEFTVTYAEALLTDRSERIGGDQVGAALASLATPTDEAVVGGWMTAFLGR